MSPARAPGALSESLQPLDLTGRDGMLRATMQAMERVAARFSRAARRSLPFMMRQKWQIIPQAVSMLGPTAPAPQQGPVFDVVLEAEDMPAWATMSLNPAAVQLLLEGSLGARAPETGGLERDLSLAQRAVVARVARGLAEHFTKAVKEEVGLSLTVVAVQPRDDEATTQRSPASGLRVECLFQPEESGAVVTLSVSAEALQFASSVEEEEVTAAGDPRMVEAVQDVTVEVSAELGTIKLGLREVLGLEVGQVLRLNTAVDDPVAVRIGGQTKFTGRPVVSRGQMAIEIRGRVE